MSRIYVSLMQQVQICVNHCPLYLDCISLGRSASHYISFSTKMFCVFFFVSGLTLKQKAARCGTEPGSLWSLLCLVFFHPYALSLYPSLRKPGCVLSVFFLWLDKVGCGLCSYCSTWTLFWLWVTLMFYHHYSKLWIWPTIDILKFLPSFSTKYIYLSHTSSLTTHALHSSSPLPFWKDRIHP